MPLVRRIPKRGFHNRLAAERGRGQRRRPGRAFAAGDEVTPESLRGQDLAKGRFDVLKVLGDGELTKKLKVSAHRFSKSAAEKIDKAGGQAIVLPGPAPVVKNKMRKQEDGKLGSGAEYGMSSRLHVEQ